MYTVHVSCVVCFQITAEDFLDDKITAVEFVKRYKQQRTVSGFYPLIMPSHNQTNFNRCDLMPVCMHLACFVVNSLFSPNPCSCTTFVKSSTKN